MSIFRRDPEPSPPKPQPQQRPAPPRPSVADRKSSVVTTHIAKGSKVVGEITGKADLHVDGHVEGSIRLENGVVVGAEGRVDGPIEAGSIHVGGSVAGSVYGRDRVEVQAGGSLEGDVTSPRVVIDPGAKFFRGKIEMSDKAPQGMGSTAPTKGSSPAGSRPSAGSSPVASAGSARDATQGTGAATDSSDADRKSGDSKAKGAATPERPDDDRNRDDRNRDDLSSGSSRFHGRSKRRGGR